MFVATLASAVMAIWSSTTASGAGALRRQRRLGVLELLVASPAPFGAVVLPITLALSAIGIYSFVAGIAYVRLLFGVTPDVADWIAFAAAIPATIISLGFFGFLLTSALVRFRSAFMIGNLLEWPVWTLSGLLVPVAFLPVFEVQGRRGATLEVA